MRTRGGVWILFLALVWNLGGCGSGGENDFPGNQPPVADAGADRNVLTGTPVELDGSGSRDPDGDRLTFRWMLLAQPSNSQTSLVDPYSPAPVLTPDLPGSYLVQLTVSDGQAISSPDTVTIRAKSPGTNQPPIADAGPDQYVKIGSLLTLDGSASRDPDGDHLSFRWLILSRPPGSNPVLSDPTVIRPDFYTDTAGEYQIQLIVSDGLTESAPDTAVITAEAAGANSAPLANAGADQTVHVGSVVNLDGSASGDPDEDSLFFAWVIVSQPPSSMVVLSAADTATPSFIPNVAGDYEIRLTVSDGRSGAATDFVLITAVPVTTNINPAADAGPDQVVQIDSVVTLDGSASEDPDGSLLNFDWALAARPASSLVALADANTARPFFVPDRSGDYRIVLTVRDIHGATASDTIIVTALPPGGNAPPTADAGKDQIVSVGSVVTLDGRNSRDPEGGSLIFSWELIAPALSNASLQNAATPTPFFFADKTGEYLVRLTVRDDQGQIATDSALILAKP